MLKYNLQSLRDRHTPFLTPYSKDKFIEKMYVLIQKLDFINEFVFVFIII